MKNTQYTLVVIFCFFISFKSAAQTPVIQWQRSLGGSILETGKSIVQTADSGYIVAGYSNSQDGDVTGLHGSQYDFWVVKLSPTGVIQWQKALGGTGSELAETIGQTKDKGYIVAGYSDSNDGDVSGNHGNADWWVVKLDDTGGIQWQRSLGGSKIDIAYSVQQTTDSGYIIAGRSNSPDGDITAHHDSFDCWVVKLSQTGAIQWERSLGGSRNDGASSVRQTFDGGYIVAGASVSTDGDVTVNHGESDLWVVKLTPTGSIQWEKSFGGAGSDYGPSIKQTADSGYIIAATSDSASGEVTGNHGDNDYWVVKLSPSGSLVWQNSFGGSGPDFAHSVQQTLDGSYIVAGITFSVDSQVTGAKGQSDMWITKLSDTGLLQWQMTLGSSGYDGAQCIQQTADSQYIVAGYSDVNNFDVASSQGGGDYWIVKLGDTSVTTNHLITPFVAQSPTLSLSPNPTANILTVIANESIEQLVISDVSGRTMRCDQYGVKEVQVDVSSLLPGMYLVSVNGLGTRRFVKQ